MRDALLELVPDSAVHVRLRGLLLSPEAEVTSSSSAGGVALLGEVGAIVGAPSPDALGHAAASHATTFWARRPWPTVAAAWERVQVAVLKPSEDAGDPSDLDPRPDRTRLAFVDAMEALDGGGVLDGGGALDRAYAHAWSVLTDAEARSVGYVVAQTEGFAALALATREDRRRRGAASRIAHALASRLLDEGRVAVVFATDSDRVAASFVEALGATPAGTLWVARR
ncbi:MAG: hypothetical protein KC586_25255 [Myxococcales bacterium]|nr:hypothetical protein [Myxococcales bacterium]